MLVNPFQLNLHYTSYKCKQVPKHEVWMSLHSVNSNLTPCFVLTNKDSKEQCGSDPSLPLHIQMIPLNIQML